MRQLKEFIETHWDGQSPLLLGYSGGPDSKALLYGLLELNVASLHVAHVDHGWRKESAAEAEEIRQEIAKLGLPFYSVRLTLPCLGNQEAIARQERLSFFRKLQKEISFQACLLAHQKNDLAETAFKRVLEGAHLPFLGGMEPISHFEELPIWRPLLGLSRSEIFAFIQCKQLTPLIDPSNLNPTYLRARMRTQIFPYLKETFGKEIESNLTLLAQRSFELKQYLEIKVADRKMEKGPWGSYVSFLGLERIEARYLLQKLQPSLPRDFLESILDALATQAPDCHFSKTLFADRGLLFLLNGSFPQFDGPFDLSIGVRQRGDWKVEVILSTEAIDAPDWKSVWKGCFSVGLPEGRLGLPLERSRFKNLWNEKKVPSFLRFQLPLLFQGGKEIKELLSGKDIFQFPSSFKVIFSIKDSYLKK